MATGGGSIFSCCSSCLDDGRNIVARHYCVDCELYFCTKCLKCHNIIPLLRKHQVNYVNVSSSNAEAETSETSTGQGGDSVESFRCTLHEGKRIDTYCKDHDKVFCGACAMVKHRSCAIVSIAVAAKDFKSSPDMKKFKEALTENLVQCKQEKEKRTDNLDSIDKQKLELIENVDKHEEKMIAKIKELADISRKEIRSKHEEHKAALSNDTESLSIVIATAEGCDDKLEQTEDGEYLFVIVKTSKKLPKDGQMLLQAMTENHKERAIVFYLDETLETSIVEKKSLGILLDCADTEYSPFGTIDEEVPLFDDDDFPEEYGQVETIFKIPLVDEDIFAEMLE